MSGTFRLLFHTIFFSITLGLGLSFFSDAGFIRLTFAGLFWAVANCYFTHAFWEGTTGKAFELFDAIGISIKGLGFGLVSIAIALSQGVISSLLGLAGLTLVIVGRALWELMIPLNSQSDESD